MIIFSDGRKKIIKNFGLICGTGNQGDQKNFLKKFIIANFY